MPGDKSISHRYALLAALADGRTTLTNYAPGQDCASTLRCLAAMGVSVEPLAANTEGPRVAIEGRGSRGLRAPVDSLDCGNSGSTLRMLAGVVAAHPFVSTLIGDRSLSSRPMRPRHRSPVENGRSHRSRLGRPAAVDHPWRGSRGDRLPSRRAERPSQERGAAGGSASRRSKPGYRNRAHTRSYGASLVGVRRGCHPRGRERRNRGRTAPARHRRAGPRRPVISGLCRRGRGGPPRFRRHHRGRRA